MSQTNGQHEDLAGNGASQESEFSVPSGPPISDFLTQLQDYNTTIPGTGKEGIFRKFIKKIYSLQTW